MRAAIRAAQGALCAAAALGLAGAADAQIELTEPAEVDVPMTFGSPLRALQDDAGTLTTQEAEALLERAYDANITPTERARAFIAAARVASREGDHAQALAWIDWAVRETALSLSGDAVAEEAAKTGVRVALAARDPLKARDYVRAHAALERGWTDDPDAQGVRVAPLGAFCPDVLADRHIRLDVRFDAPVAGSAQARPAHCLYRPIRPAEELPGLEIELYATRSWIPAADRIRGVTEVGLDPADAAARAAVAKRLPTELFLVDRDRSRNDVGRFGYARYSRLGVDETATYVYALTSRDGSLFAVRVTADLRDWPPEPLRRVAETALIALQNDAPS